MGSFYSVGNVMPRSKGPLPPKTLEEPVEVYPPTEADHTRLAIAYYLCSQNKIEVPAHQARITWRSIGSGVCQDFKSRFNKGFNGLIMHNIRLAGDGIRGLCEDPDNENDQLVVFIRKQIVLWRYTISEMKCDWIAVFNNLEKEDGYLRLNGDYLGHLHDYTKVRSQLMNATYYYRNVPNQN